MGRGWGSGGGVEEGERGELIAYEFHPGRLENMLSRIIKDTTTFEMELCGCKQATAHAHVQAHCM